MRQCGDLWKYLESHKSLALMPSLQDLRFKFGEPDQIDDASNTINPSIWGVTDDAIWYARYTPEEKQMDWIEYIEWTYRHDESRQVSVLSRKRDGTILGWMWFENVPEGQEQGPPKD